MREGVDRGGPESPEKDGLPAGSTRPSVPYQNRAVDLEHLPGGDLVAKGLRDLAEARETDEALLVSIGAPRLRRQGLPVERPFPDPEHRLYERLADSAHARFNALVEDPEHRLYERLARVDSDSAHARYNALVGRLTSFENALECVG